MWRCFKAVLAACFLFLLNGAPVHAATVPPSITGEGVSSITATDATLEAEIDPGSASAYYQFQLAETPSEFADEIFCPTSPQSKPLVLCAGPESATDLPVRYISHGEGEVTVKLDLASVGVTLKPGTNYYFRAVAASAVQTEDTIEWEQPVVGGQEGTFTTLPESANPEPGSGGSPVSSKVGSESPQLAEPSPFHHRRHHRRHRRGRASASISRARAAR